MSSWKTCDDVDIYFATSSIAGWVCVFTDKLFSSIIVNSLKYCSDHKGLIIHGYVIMPNHIHLLANGSGKLSDIMRDFKTFTSAQISTLANKKGYQNWLGTFRTTAEQSKKNDNYKVWQNGFHPIAVYSKKFYKQKLHYIHQNPVKKGYVTAPEHWFYSSARNYAGIENRPLDVKIL